MKLILFLIIVKIDDIIINFIDNIKSIIEIYFKLYLQYYKKKIKS